mgnify:CR=1 FL=1
MLQDSSFPHTHGAVERMERRKSDQKAAQGKTANLALGTPAAQKSPKSGKFLTNINAKDWHLISPDGKEYKFESKRISLNHLD